MTDQTEQLSRQIDRFEKAWRYDAAYMRDLLRAGPETLKTFQTLASIVDTTAAPSAVLFTAQTLAVLDGDCEPCVQLGVDMALAGGLDPKVARAVLLGDESNMTDDVRLVYRFALASLRKDAEGLEPYRFEILERWGERGLTAIALSIMAGRMYPTLKYPLGYGHPCTRVTVAGEVVPISRKGA